MERSMIVNGAGIAGLATGCYGQMNGYRTRIFEMHDKPGGLCTAWKRRGYTIDGCIHWLIGAGPGSSFYRVWEELGAVQERPMIYYDEFTRVEGPDGQALTVYTDIDRLAQHLKTLSPTDSGLIEEYAAALRRFTRIELFALPILRPGEILARMLPAAGSLLKWGRISMGDFGARFQDPFLRRAFPLIHGYPPLPMAVHLTNLASMHIHTAGWPAGGSLEFARAIERRYRELGGEVHYRARVDEILVEAGSERGRGASPERGRWASPERGRGASPERSRGNNRATGVRLADGSVHHADVVVSAADGYATIFGMLGGRYTDKQIRSYYAQEPEPDGYAVHVSLGVARDLSHEPHTIILLLDEPITAAGQTLERLTVEHFSFDPAMAPPGKSTIKVYLESAHGYWKDLYAERERYKAEKERTASAVIDQLERRFPGLREQIEMVDVATPMTTERYTGNRRGTQAWLPKKGSMRVLLKGMSKTLPGLDGFYMVGQWTGAMGGLPTVAAAGRNLVRLLCKRDGRAFVTTVPGQ